MSPTVVIGTATQLEMLATFGTGILLAVVIGVRTLTSPTILASWTHISWQQARPAVRLVARRRSATALILVAVELALYLTHFYSLAILLSAVTIDALIRVAHARWALRRIEQPAVRLGRRGGWLYVQGSWVCCGEAVLERAAVPTAAQSRASVRSPS